MTRIVFMGTPAFAVPSLQALLAQHAVVGVVTQPDRPAGRGRQVVEPAVKQAARAAGVPVIQPRRLREPEALAQLREWAPEVIVVAAFGQILRPEVLDLPPHGCVNVHASLLPRHRGAAPVAAAIIAGDAETGITLMRMDVGLDTGPMLAQATVPIEPDDTTETLTERLAPIGGWLLAEKLPLYLAGRLRAQPQNEAEATYAPQLKKEDGQLDFTRPAVELERRVRAFQPWPGAFAVWPAAEGQTEARTLKILRAAVLDEPHGEPGRVVATPQGPAVAAGAGALLLVTVQPPGKRPMPAIDFGRGARGFLEARLR